MANSIHAQKSISIEMEDGSIIEGSIIIDIETTRDNSVADRQLWDFTPGLQLQIMSSLLEQLLTDSPHDEDDEDDQGDDDSIDEDLTDEE
jgi:hypothetical protein